MALKLFINGERVSSVKGKTFPVYNPATGAVILGTILFSHCYIPFMYVTDCSNATEEDIHLAVNSAKICLNSPNWGFNSTGKQRAEVLRKLGEIITLRKDEIAQLDSHDMGKPLRESLADVGDAEAACAHFADLAEKQDAQQDEVIDNGVPPFTTKLRYEPVGVIGAITPWNYPFLMGY